MPDRDLTRDESLEIVRLHADIERLLARAMKLRKGLPLQTRQMFYQTEANLARAELEAGVFKEMIVSPSFSE